MSKRKKNKKKQKQKKQLLPTRLTAGLSESELINAVYKNMEADKFRRAVLLAEELFNRSREKFEHIFVDCCNAFADQLIDSGRSDKAAEVWEKLRSVTGRNAGTSIPEAITAMRAGDAARAVHTVEQVLSVQDASFADSSDKAIADILVLGFSHIRDLEEICPRIYRDAAAVHRALECLCLQGYEQSAENLRDIPFKSVFSEWKLFIKGLCAFYSGSDGRAREAFSKLSPDFLPGRTSLLYRYIHDDDGFEIPRDMPKEPFYKNLCALLGDNSASSVMPRAEYLWQSGRYKDSFVYTAKNIKGFPADGTGFAALLSQFYLCAIFDIDRSQDQKYIEAVYKQLAVSRRAPDSAVVQWEKVLSLYFQHYVDDKELVSGWQDFLSLYCTVYGKHDALAARIYEHLGDLFSAEEEQDTFLPPLFRRGTPRLRNPSYAEKMYSSSIQLNPGDKTAHIKLVNLYEKTGNTRALNKKLDEISALFPDDKIVLFKNGNNCINRKAYLKGITYLEKAHNLDPIDPSVKQSLCLGYILASLHYAKKKKPERYRAFMQAAAALDPGSENMYTFCPAYLRVRLAGFEAVAGNREEAEQLSARILAEGDTELLYFALLIWRAYKVPDFLVKQYEKKMKSAFADAGCIDAVTRIRVVSYISRIDMPMPWIRKEHKKVIFCAKKAVKNDCDPESAKHIIAYALMQEDRDARTLVNTLIKKMLTEYPGDPWFRYYAFRNNMHKSIPGEKDIETLQEVLRSAQKINDMQLVQIVSREIGQVKRFIEIAGTLEFGLDALAPDRSGEDAPFFDDEDMLGGLYDDLSEPAPKRQKPQRRKNKNAAGTQRSLFDLINPEDDDESV